MRNGNAAQTEKKPEEANESSTCRITDKSLSTVARFENEALGLKQSRICREKKKLEEENTENFFKDPFQFARQLFQQPRSGTLAAQKEELKNLFHKAYSDP
ncbi:reverse transcriptase [Plakobranchus ocellatus]|uniref:Reverse transcriptase n=1 Tax=Plakobranchus ocellatus TaxID=259542 RepID=A0AAV4BUB3_9GAST|nr:reverse transcriptase [Plakobranchus ocellatus]